MKRYSVPSKPNINSNNVNDIKIKEAEVYLQNAKSITLVLGAGTSLHYNLPSWDTLLFKLYEIARKPKTVNYIRLEYELLKLNSDNLNLAQYINDDPKVKDISKLRDILYNDFLQSSDIKISPLHKSIIDLIKKGKNLNIITYNFDGILEYYLKKNNIDFNLSYGECLNHSIDGLNIYHVHGYLPINETISKDVILTFTESQYISQYNNIYSWKNLIQLEKFSNSPCVFIGLSFSDPNLKKLLFTKIIKDGIKHYKLDIPFDIYSFNEFKEKNYKNLDLKLKNINDSILIINDSKLDQCKKLGLELLNFSKYDDFPNFIDKVF